MANRYAIILNAGSGYASVSEVVSSLPNSIVGAADQTYTISWNYQGGSTINNEGSVTSIRYAGHEQEHNSSSAGTKFQTHTVYLDAPAQTTSLLGGYGKIQWRSGENSNGKAADASNIARGIAGESNDNGEEVSRNAAIANNFNITRNGATIRFIHKTNDNTFDLVTSDGLAGNGMSSVFKSVNSITDLPTVAPDGFKVKVIGDAELDQDDYYVKFQTHDDSAFSAGAWQEASGFDVSVGFSADTMPMQIVSKGNINGSDTFELGAGSWTNRLVGDDNSNPMPSFVGDATNPKFITNMFFFKNRLGFMSNDNIIMSEAGEPYNFFRNTTTVLLDSAPIDIQVASNKVTNLKQAIAFQENLVLFAENGQFVLKGGELLSPSTVSVTPITSFDYKSSVPPLSLGSYVYFPFGRGGFSGVREFTINSTTDTYDSVDITEQVPSYLPNNIVSMTGNSSENILALISSDEPDTIYIYSYFWNNRQKILSSWSKFKIQGEIKSIEFMKSKLYIVVSDTVSGIDETNLLEMSLEAGLKDSTTGPNLLLDYAHTPTSNTIPFNASGLTLECYDKATGANMTAFFSHTATTYQFPTPNYHLYTVGVPYTMKYKFSDQIFKSTSGSNQTPSDASKMHLRNGTLFVTETTSFDVKVTPSGRSITNTNSFEASDLPAATTIGAIKQVDGKYRFPIYAQGRGTSIVIEADDAYPVKLNSAEFESFVVPRSKRYG